MNAFMKAIHLSGGTQQTLADLLGVTQAHVSYWKCNQIPVKRAIEIERALNGQVTRNELRPDIFGEQAA